VLAHGEAACEGWVRLDERPFDFERRRVSVLAEKGGAAGDCGAPETVLALCDQAEKADGSLVPMDEGLRKNLMALHDARAAGLRLLGWRGRMPPGASGLMLTMMAASSSRVFACLWIRPSPARVRRWRGCTRCACG
jgi:magnesium-transporting ATPase (P-type)